MRADSFERTANFVFGEDAIKGIQCPVCRHEFMHIGGVRDLRGADYPNGDKFRQGRVEVLFDGECGHKVKLVIGEHKGNVYQFVEDA